MRKEIKNKNKILEDIKKEFEKAKKEFLKDPKLGKKMVKRIKIKAMRKNIALPKDIKQEYCKKCFSIFFPGKNCKIRIKDKKKVTKCLECHTIKRVVFKINSS